MDRLNSIFFVAHPVQDIERFWKQAKSIRPKAPTDAFSSLCSLRLVGLFKVLDNRKNKKNKSNLENENAVVCDRFPTDLPEMQTLMTYDNGRFCYWRDTPKDSEPFLVHVFHTTDHFPKMEIVGNSNLFCALHCLLKILALPASKMAQYKALFPETYDPSHYDSILKEAKRKRSKISIGSPFHGLGIRVTVEDDVGYRTVTDNLKRLKREIETMGTTDNDSVKQTLRRNFLELHSNIQYANDEKDFGMGLEFGHDIFVSNYECFDGLAKSVLKHAYNLLDRGEFVKILDAHYAAGRRNPENIK